MQPGTSLFLALLFSVNAPVTPAPTTKPTPVPPSAVPGRESAEKAAALIEQIIAAMGGREALTSLKSLRENCSFFVENETYPMQKFWRSPDRMRSEFLFDEGKVVRVLDSEKAGLFLEAGQVTQTKMISLSKDDVASLRLTVADVGFSYLLNYKERGDTVEFMGTERVGHEFFLVLRWRTTEGHLTTRYIDLSTKLPRREERRFVGALDFPVQTTVSDYRRVGGLNFPFRSVTVDLLPPVTKVICGSIELNAALPDDLFAMPNIHSLDAEDAIKKQSARADYEADYWRRKKLHQLTPEEIERERMWEDNAQPGPSRATGWTGTSDNKQDQTGTSDNRQRRQETMSEYLNTIAAVRQEVYQANSDCAACKSACEGYTENSGIATDQYGNWYVVTWSTSNAGDPTCIMCKSKCESQLRSLAQRYNAARERAISKGVFRHELDIGQLVF